MRASIHVRPARPGEASVLSSLAWEAKASWGYPEAWLDHRAADLSVTARYIERHAVWVAEVNRDIVGFAAAQLKGGLLQLAHLWVRPTHHGRGVGRTLVATVAEYTASFGCDSFRVVSDPHAASFYERLGGRRMRWVDASFEGVDRRLPVLQVPVHGAAHGTETA